MEAGTPPPAAPDAPPTDQKKGVAQNVWSFATIAVTMACLVFVTLIVLQLATKDSSAATILGVILPGVLSIATASFGVAVAADANGKRERAEAGKETAERGRSESDRKRNEAEAKEQKAEEKSERAEESVKKAANYVDTAKKITLPLIQGLRAAGSSPAGSDALDLPPTRFIAADAGEPEVDHFLREEGGAGGTLDIIELSVGSEDLIEAETALRMASESLALDPEG